jgi:RHS repeat-associated protein
VIRSCLAFVNLGSLDAYDAFGNLAAEYGGTVQLSGTQYVGVDALGSTRIVMGAQTERHDFKPFGEEPEFSGWRTLVAGHGVDGTRRKFTGADRDGGSKADYMIFRYYSTAQGRFMSVDPDNAGADPSDPQTWNGYAYVGNNPLKFTDPTGLGGEGAIGGATICGPVCAGIGAAVDLGLALWFLFGGSAHSVDLGPLADSVSGSPQVNSPSGGPLGTGTVFGGGNTSPFIFSLENGTAPVSGPPTGFWYGWLWLSGQLPRRIYYSANTQGTRDMMRSTVVQSMRSDYIKAGCPTYAKQDSGHSEPWKESARNGIFLNTTQFEVGGFGMESAASPDGATVSHTIRNTTGWSSLTGFSTWGRKLGARGNELDTRRRAGANVEQIFVWTEPNPCHESTECYVPCLA